MLDTQMPDAARSRSSATGREGGAPLSEHFHIGMRSAQQVWLSTPVLSRVGRERASRICQVLAQGSGSQIAALLVEMAGPAFAAAAVPGLSADRATKLCELIVQMAADTLQLQAAGAAADALARLQALTTLLCAWIDTGQGPGDLTRAGGHTTGEQRLGMLAPVAPPIAFCTHLLRAVESKVPLQSWPHRPEEQPA